MIMINFTENNIFTYLISKNKILVYMPYSNYAVILNEAEINMLGTALENNQERVPRQIEEILSFAKKTTCSMYKVGYDVDEMLNLMILPNNKCNFHCSYCYSAYGRSNEELDIETIKTCLDYFLSPERVNGRRVTISILGGGEPFISWEIVKSAIDYAYEINTVNKNSLPVSIVSNCSILNDDILNYCKKHDIYVCASFDILEDIQNKQRSQFTKVSSNIKTMINAGLNVDITSVITKDNVHRMNEMIEEVNKEYKGIKRITFRHMISDTYFDNAEERRKYYIDFVDNFFTAQLIADKYGIDLTCPYQNSLVCITNRHCPGKFVLTASGEISTCFCVSSTKDKYYSDFIYGRVDSIQNKVIINKAKVKEIMSNDVKSSLRCRNCFAKLHCAGGCYSDNHFMSSEEHDAYCDAMRYFLAKYLIKHHNLNF